MPIIAIWDLDRLALAQPRHAIAAAAGAAVHVLRTRGLRVELPCNDCQQPQRNLLRALRSIRLVCTEYLDSMQKDGALDCPSHSFSPVLTNGVPRCRLPIFGTTLADDGVTLCAAGRRIGY